MPRERLKTRSGAPAQDTTSAPGVRYGEGVQYSQLQQAMPTPNARAQSAAPAPSSAPASLPPEAAAAGYSRTPVAMPEPGLLLAPTARPNESVTTGLVRGPGAGPSALSIDTMQSPTGKLLRDLSKITGRQVFADMARRSGM